MNSINRIFIFFVMLSMAACVPGQLNITASDEDQDIGIGGTGMLANKVSGTAGGLGGTGIVGEITGFGSIFVNGVEIEYDSETPFTVNGKTAAQRQLAVGDVVEVLTSDASKHTEARMINLRHEIIGKVESVNVETYSFIVKGQTVVQGLNTGALPVPGSAVAVSGFRVDGQTIKATRVTPAGTQQSLLRMYMVLPFNKQTTRWLLQTHLQNGQAMVRLEENVHVLSIKKKNEKFLKGHLNVRILQLQKTDSGQLMLDKVIEPMDVLRGQTTEKSLHQPGVNMKRQGTATKQPGNNVIRAPVNIHKQQNMHRKGR